MKKQDELGLQDLKELAEWLKFQQGANASIVPLHPDVLINLKKSEACVRCLVLLMEGGDRMEQAPSGGVDPGSGER